LKRRYNEHDKSYSCKGLDLSDAYSKADHPLPVPIVL